MMRGWIIAVAVACTANTLSAQDGAGTRYRQQPAAEQALDARPRIRVDRHVKPAAVAAEKAARQRAQRQPAPKSSGGLFGGLKMPNLIPKSMRGGSDHEVNDAPMPYDPSELSSQPRNGQSRPRTSQQSPASRAPSRQQAARSTAQPPARTASAPQRTAQPESRPTSQVARSSPTPSTRRNELAEALSGLTSSHAAKTDAAAPPEPIEMAEETDIAPPMADDAEEVPSYVVDTPAVQAKPPVAAKPKAAAVAAAPKPVAAQPSYGGPRDLHDALLSEDDPTAPAEPRSEAIVAEAPVESINRDDLVAPPMPSTKLAAPSSASRVSSKDAAAAFRARSGEGKAAGSNSLGEVVAEAPNSGFETKPGGSSTAKIQSKTAASANAVRPSRGVLFSSTQPIISSHIEGPQQIVVGRQAEYRVTVENKGEVAARDLVAAIAAPAGAELMDATASNGTVERLAAEGDATGGGEIKWQLYELPAGATQTLTMQLIPRSGREMQLGVQLTHAPTVSQATVEIQEPKLHMEITGPSDVLFGKSQRYSLTLNNPGNGAAEDVAIELTPPGGDKASMVRHKVGTIAPGETKKIELELTAREAGELKIKAAALAANDLRTETEKSVLCRKAELQVDWRGPEKKYAGAVATYYVRVRNPGTAAAEQVAVKLNLPTGAELIDASEGHEWDGDRRVVLWKAAGLNAGEERFMEVQCRMSQPGVNKLELSAQSASGDLSDAKSVPVTVEALADLKLEVSDPKGVVPVGDTATYEVHIKNRGMTAAKGVNIVAMFSEGIDPSNVEGGQHAIRDGRVTFRAIDLAAGAETVLKIHAKATQPGTHIFRAEVACEELEVKLAAEETTRFFTEEDRWADASTAYADEAGTATR